MSFDYTALRARQARFARRFSRPVRLGLWTIALALVAFGIMLLMIDQSTGWLLLGLATIPLIVIEWYRDALQAIALGKGDDISDVLESDLLGRLPRELTPQILAERAMQVQSGQFFAGRFGISAQFIGDLSSTNSADTATVFSRAVDMQRAIGEKTMTAGMIVAALCATQPQLSQLLPHLQIDETDLENGVRWYARLLHLIAEQKKPRLTGGIARDWSFGYANVLGRFGVNISDQAARGGVLHVRLDSHQTALKSLFETFSSGGRQNIALVGPTGIGKSTIVRAFAESLILADSSVASTLKYRQIISLDASSIISSVRSRGELEELVNHLLVEAFTAKNIILCFDDAQLFFEEGPGSVDISSTLLPILEGGRLKIILTMDEQRYLQIAARHPNLASALNRVSIGPASERETMMVMQDQLIGFEFDRKVTYMYQALKEAYRLSERYMHELAQPGRAVRLLEQAAGFAESSVVTAGSVAQAIEQSSGVKVGRVDTSDERQTLLQLEDKIHERMINQTRAVQVVADALRRARAGVRNESRPIGTFLFLGPTGVGKTELSKALADVYFGGENRLVRLDLNEFVRPDDVSRLIADGSSDPHSLTASIMKQPFSVVLLDEIEKAHPQVLTTLLQLLDEGVLRDINNREVSFRDAIIIATSNAGAERIRELITAGQNIEQCEEMIVSELIDSQQFRPEFLNRFDEIVVFRPLTEDELTQVVALIIKGINKTLEPQKIAVSVDEAASRKLAQIGYDPRLGARPMRRVVQRSVESLIARRLLEGSVQPGQTISITESDIQA